MKTAIWIVLALAGVGYAQPDTSWMKTYEGSEFYEIIPDGEGGYFVSGRYYRTVEYGADFQMVHLDSDGRVLWSTFLVDSLSSGAFALCYADSSVYLAGAGSSPSDGCAIIARVSLQGDSIWYRRGAFQSSGSYTGIIPKLMEAFSLPVRHLEMGKLDHRMGY